MNKITFTERILENNDEFSEKIYDIEDRLCTIEEGAQAVTEYLKRVELSLSLGIALRRCICDLYGTRNSDGGYTLRLTGFDDMMVGDYLREGYDIKKDDVETYVKFCLASNALYNTDGNGECRLNLTKAEFRRLLRLDTACVRKKVFMLSFALHMNTYWVTKLLNDCLGEQSYNVRDPYEIIAYFCHTHEGSHSYPSYLELKKKYDAEIAPDAAENTQRDNYTYDANKKIREEIENEEDLFEFLSENKAEFFKYSHTIYGEFRAMFEKAYELSVTQNISNDELFDSPELRTVDQIKEREQRIEEAYGIHKIENKEQFVRRMLQFIPRATEKKERKGRTVIENDFISIRNEEGGEAQDRPKTTILPKEITTNLLVRDRLDDLLTHKKPVERKDLVFMKFYLFSLEAKETYSYSDYQAFLDECNAMLARCGMSRLYAGNRFENLILLSLVSSIPFEMFENIIDASFINEPGYDGEDGE